MKMRQLIAAAIVLAALAATLYWSNHRQPSVDTANAAASAPTKIISLAQDDVTKLEIKKKDGDDVVLNRVSSGGWKITSPRALIADPDPISTILYSLAPMEATTLIADKAGDLKQYGLTDPAVKVSATEKDGKSQTILVGDDTPTGDSAYVMLSGDSRVFTVPKNTKTNLNKGAKDLCDKRLLPVNFDKVASVEIAGPKLKFTIGTENGQWTIRNPKEFRGNTTKLQSLVNELKAADMDPSTSDEDTKKAASSFASGSPIATVKAADDSGSYELQIRKDKDTYYAKTTAMDGAFKLSNSLGAAIDKNLEDFRQDRVFDFASDTPEKVEMQDGPKTYLLTRDGDDWLSNGKKMDPASVEDFLGGLRTLTATKFPAAGFSHPALTITVTSRDGKRVEKVEIAKSGNDYVAKREDGPTLYQLDAKVIADLQESANVMKPAELSAPQK